MNFVLEPLSVALRGIERRYVIVNPFVGVPLKYPDGTVHTFNTYGAAADYNDTFLGGIGFVRPHLTIE